MIALAVAAGMRSPCAKSKRGAVVFDPEDPSFVFGIGCNGQPTPLVCTDDTRCRAACGMLCVHAEVRAIRGLMPAVARGLELVHAKVVDGMLVAGGGPSCWQCSREILDVGLAAVWLYERTWETCRDEDGCAYCDGSACGECEDVPHAAVHSPQHHDRHFGLDEQPPRWRRYTAEEFHRATLRSLEIVR